MTFFQQFCQWATRIWNYILFWFLSWCMNGYKAKTRVHQLLILGWANFTVSTLLCTFTIILFSVSFRSTNKCFVTWSAFWNTGTLLREQGMMWKRLELDYCFCICGACNLMQTRLYSIWACTIEHSWIYIHIQQWTRRWSVYSNRNDCGLVYNITEQLIKTAEK